MLYIASADDIAVYKHAANHRYYRRALAYAPLLFPQHHAETKCATRRGSHASLEERHESDSWLKRVGVTVLLADGAIPLRSASPQSLPSSAEVEDRELEEKYEESDSPSESGGVADVVASASEGPSGESGKRPGRRLPA